MHENKYLRKDEKDERRNKRQKRKQPHPSLSLSLSVRSQHTTLDDKILSIESLLQMSTTIPSPHRL